MVKEYKKIKWNLTKDWKRKVIDHSLCKKNAKTAPTLRDKLSSQSGVICTLGHELFTFIKL